MRFRLAVLLALGAAVALAGCTDQAPPADGGEDGNGTGAGNQAVTAGEWSSLAPVPTERTEVGSAVLDGELWVIGGIGGSNDPSPVVEALSLEEETWRSPPDLPMPLHHARAVAVDGTLHVLGGYNAIPFQATHTHLTLEPGDATWTRAPELPAARGAHGAALVDGSIVLAGGVGADGELLEAVHAYDPDEGSWSSLAEMPTPREHLAAAAADGALHTVAGRQGGFDTNRATHEVLVPGEGWTQLPDAPTARGGLYAATVAGHVVAVGGEGNDGTFEEVEAYDPATGTWTRLPDLPTPRHGLAVDVHEDTLLAAAGGPEPGFTVSGATEALSVRPNG